MARPRPAPTAAPCTAATMVVSMENSRTACSYSAEIPPMPPLATLSPGVVKSAPAQKFLPAACSTMARA